MNTAAAAHGGHMGAEACPAFQPGDMVLVRGRVVSASGSTVLIETPHRAFVEAPAEDVLEAPPQARHVHGLNAWQEPESAHGSPAPRGRKPGNGRKGKPGKKSGAERKETRTDGK